MLQVEKPGGQVGVWGTQYVIGSDYEHTPGGRFHEFRLFLSTAQLPSLSSTARIVFARSASSPRPTDLSRSRTYGPLNWRSRRSRSRTNNMNCSLYSFTPTARPSSSGITGRRPVVMPDAEAGGMR